MTRIEAWLRDAGYEATHVIDHCLLCATDDVILTHAMDNQTGDRFG